MNTIKDHDPAFTYENLVRAAFDNCRKYEDPFGLAHQELYGQALAEPIGHDIKFGISIALRKVSHQFRDNEERSNQLMELDQSVWSANSQDDIINVLESAADIFHELGL